MMVMVVRGAQNERAADVRNKIRHIIFLFKWGKLIFPYLVFSSVNFNFLYVSQGL